MLPLLRKNYQPALDRTIARVMEIVGAEAELASLAAREWLRALGSPKEGRRATPKEAKASLGRLPRGQEGFRFDDLPVAVQRRCVRLQLLCQGIEPDFELIEQLRVAAGRPVSLGLGTPEPRVRTWMGRGMDGGPLRPPEGQRAPFRAGKEKLGGTGGTPVLRYAVRDGKGRVLVASLCKTAV